MELDELRRQALAARCFTVPIAEGVAIQLRTPTKHESSVVYTRVAVVDGALDRAATLRWQRVIVAQAVTGWSGVLLRHLLADHAGAEALEFNAGVVELLLDNQPGWEETLTNALLDEMRKRKEAQDTAAKN